MVPIQALPTVKRSNVRRPPFENMFSKDDAQTGNPKAQIRSSEVRPKFVTSKCTTCTDLCNYVGCAGSNKNFDSLKRAQIQCEPSLKSQRCNIMLRHVGYNAQKSER